MVVWLSEIILNSKFKENDEKSSKVGISIPSICITPAEPDDETGNGSVFEEDSDVTTDDDKSQMADIESQADPNLDITGSTLDLLEQKSEITTVSAQNSIQEAISESEIENDSAEEFEMPDEALLDTKLLPISVIDTYSQINGK